MGLTVANKFAAVPPGTTGSTIVFGSWTLIAGRTVVFCICNGSGNTVSTVVDTAGNVWHSTAAIITGAYELQFWYAYNVIGQVGNTLTVTLSGVSDLPNGYLWEISGTGTTDPTDVSIGGTNSGTTPITSNTFSTAVTDELMLAFAMNNRQRIHQHFAAPTGWLLDFGDIGDNAGSPLQYAGAQHKLVSAVQSGVTASMSFTHSATIGGGSVALINVLTLTSVAAISQQNNIAVAGLKTAEKYFDHFAVEMHNDMSGSSRVGVQTVSGTWNPNLNEWDQANLVSFDNCEASTLYFFRSATVDIQGNYSPWSDWISATSTSKPTTPATPIIGMDPIIHGDPLGEIDAGYVLLRDDFRSGQITAGQNQVGELGWIAAKGSGGSTYFFQGAPPHIGELGIGVGNNSNDHGTLRLTNNDFSQGVSEMPLFDYPSWKMVWVFRLTRNYGAGLGDQFSTPFNTAQRRLYIGLMAPAGTDYPRPQCFMGLRYDTDTGSPSIGDTTYNFEVVENPCGSTASNTQGQVFNTGISPVLDVWHRFEMQCVAVGVVTMSIDGSAPQSFTLTNYQFGGVNTAMVAGNGVLQFSAANQSGTNKPPFASGSIVTVSGITHPTDSIADAAENGIHILAQQNGNNSQYWNDGASFANHSLTTNAQLTGLPAVVPGVNVGTDTAATPTDNFACHIDFFGFLWNPGVKAWDAAVPDPTLSRYF